MSEELKKEIDDILYAENDDTDLEFHGERVGEIMTLIKQERIRYGEWLLQGIVDNNYDDHNETLDFDGIAESTLIKLRELRQRNKGEIDRDKDRDNDGDIDKDRF